MTGWLSFIVAVLVILIVFIHPQAAASFATIMGGNQMAFPAVLMLVTLTAHIIARRSPGWKLGRHAGEWASLLAVLVILVSYLPFRSLDTLRDLLRLSDSQDSFLPSRPLALARGAWTEIASDGQGHFRIKAYINDVPLKVLVDTGATAVALSHEDAMQAGIHDMDLHYSLPVSTANGTVKAAPVTLRRIEIDGIVVNDVKAWVMPRGALRGTLLGMSFLRRLSTFRIDHGKLVLGQ